MDEGKAKPHKMCESAEEWIAMRMAEMKPGEPFAPDFALDPSAVPSHAQAGTWSAYKDSSGNYFRTDGRHVTYGDSDSSDRAEPLIDLALISDAIDGMCRASEMQASGQEAKAILTDSQEKGVRDIRCRLPHGRGSDDWMDYISDPPTDLMTSTPWWNSILRPSNDGRWAETAYWWDQMRSRPELYERFMKRRIEMVKTYCLREGITEVLEEKEVEMTEEGKKMLDALLRMSTRIGIPEEPPERYRRKD